MATISEKNRLKVLESYDLNNGYPKNRLKPISKLASEVCDCPVSLINVIDESHQRTIAVHGDWKMKYLPRDKSICDRVVLKDDLLVINNLDNNRKISARLPKEYREKIKFYAGIPLKSVAGYNIGALCVLDFKPRELSKAQIENFRILANQAVAQLDLYKQKGLVRKQKRKLEKYSAFLKNSADIMCVIDPDTGIIIDINGGVEKILGFPREHYLGENFLDFVKFDERTDEGIEKWFSEENRKNARHTTPVRLKNKQHTEKWFNCNFTREKNRCYVTARNVTDQKEGMHKLQDKFKKVVNVTTDLIYELDWKSGELIWGDELTDILGYPNSEKFVNYDWWLDKIHPEDLDRVLHDVSREAESDSMKWKLIYRLRTNDGSYKFILNHKHVDRDENGKPNKIVGALIDISDLKEAEQQSDQNLRLLKELADQASAAVWIRDKKGKHVFVNQEYKSLFDLEKRSVVGKTVHEIFDEKTARQFYDNDQNALNFGESAVFEERVNTADGDRYYRTNTFPLCNIPGQGNLVGGIAIDITDQKNNQELIENSLKEKETLLAEIHHRVKNNLAVISGLLELNLNGAEDQTSVDYFKSSQSRIKSMAKIHEMLYESQMLSHISFREYIKELISEIKSTFQREEFESQFETNIDDIHLDINQAIPCGLILNELISNTLKHAFPGREKGTVKVSFTNQNDKILLSVADDGVGVSEDFNSEDSKSLGITLVEILSKQLQADVSIGNADKGFKCSVRFEKKENVKGSGSALNNIDAMKFETGT